MRSPRQPARQRRRDAPWPACVAALLCLLAPLHAEPPRAAADYGLEPPPTADPRAMDELRRFFTLVPAARIHRLPDEPLNIEVKGSAGYTIEQLRGVPIDPNPPQLRDAGLVYDPRMTDDHPPGTAPYVARDIAPFRFRHFHCEFNYGGWHNFAMHDYAATHGFDIIFPYVRPAEQWAAWPEGTAILKWGGFVNWHEWLPAHDIPEGHYHRLTELPVADMLFAAGLFDHKEGPRPEYLMIDMEHPVLSPDQLRQADFYPRDADDKARAEFETRYYRGYALTYIAPVEAARRAGWKNISLYGWQPYGRTWGGLEKPEVDPGDDFAWNTFGRDIYAAVDLLNPSVYCFYWTPQNVAYTLANIDSNLKLARSTDTPKPARPYYWTLLHGGGGGWRWWRGQPLSDEDQRAMTLMGFFTGFDGFDTWNWSGTGNHHRPALASRERIEEEGPDGTKKVRHEWVNADVQVAVPFTATGTDGKPHDFRRYDHLHVTDPARDGGQARFQLIRPKARDHGVGGQHPVFAMDKDELLALLRPASAPVAAMIEGMAMAKVLEYILRHGTPHDDLPARASFGGNMPVVRRVTLDKLHLVATYDPAVAHGGEPRPVLLWNFADVPGRHLTLDADADVRVYLFRDP